MTSRGEFFECLVGNQSPWEVENSCCCVKLCWLRSQFLLGGLYNFLYEVGEHLLLCMQVFHILHSLFVACFRYLLWRIVRWFLIQQRHDEEIDDTATRVTRSVPVDFGGTSPFSMAALTALTCSVLRRLCNSAAAAFSLYDLVMSLCAACTDAKTV